MGILDDALHEFLMATVAERPDLTEEQFDVLVEKAVCNSLPEMAERVCRSLLEAKEEPLFENRLQMEAFVRRNIFRWREGLEVMDILSTVSWEIVQTAIEVGKPDENLPETCKRRAILRLHARARQIYSEIVCLLKHGFADGALARWRALHEVAVVASLLSEHGEDLAERFLEFSGIESWRSMSGYQENADALGLEPFTPEELEQAKGRYKALLQKYGDSFRGNYGWAASVVTASNGNAVTFWDLEKSIEVDHLKPYYRLACQKIHVGCVTLHKSLGVMDCYTDEVMIAGPSNAGHCDPAQLAARSFHMVTCTLTSIVESMDVLVGCAVSGILADKITDAFFRAHQRLEEEEAEIQRQASIDVEDSEEGEE